MLLFLHKFKRIPFLKAKNEEHVQTHEIEFLLPNDWALQLTDFEIPKSYKQELQSAKSSESSINKKNKKSASSMVNTIKMCLKWPLCIDICQKKKENVIMKKLIEHSDLDKYV